MIELGHYSLIASLLLCSYGMIAATIGGMRRSLPLVRSAENAVLAHFAILSIASLCLWYLLLTDEFLVEYVAGYSARDIPTAYKFTAFWGGQKGSLLLWAMVLSLFSGIAVIQNRNKNRDLMPYTTAVLLGAILFFMVLLFIFLYQYIYSLMVILNYICKPLIILFLFLDHFYLHLCHLLLL